VAVEVRRQARRQVVLRHGWAVQRAMAAAAGVGEDRKAGVGGKAGGFVSGERMQVKFEYLIGFGCQQKHTQLL